ncbi:MAG: DUF4349 domain-containing protein [Treponema sp.]|nr:DUF4349 domain-containing protein [Treponema sp.]
MKKIIVLVLLASLLIFGCGKQSSPEVLYGGRAQPVGMVYEESLSRTTSAYMDMSGDSPRDGRGRQASASVMNMSDSTDLGAGDIDTFERKLVKRASIRIRVENLETADNSVASLLEKYNGYAASTSIEENSRYYSLRVPTSQYDVFLAEMDGIGRLLGRYESTDDVTLRYYDLESRLDSKRELLRTFQAYLRRANTMEEILSVEARIADLQRDIEYTGTQLRNLANMVDYSTIDLSLMGPVAMSPTRSVTLGERIKQLFGGFGNFLSTVAVVLLGFVITVFRCWRF